MTYGPTPNPPRGPWRALRTALLLVLGWGFVAVVLEGYTGNIGRMPPWAGILDINQINQIGAYLETLADEKKAHWK